MRIAKERAAALAFTIVLLTVCLSCAEYSVLVHARIVSPPSVYIQIGHYTLLSGVDSDAPCPYCPTVANEGPTIFYVAIIAHEPATSSAPRVIIFLHVPLAAR
jgi:hypothetical protein